MDKLAIFIDAGYVTKILSQEFDSTKIDYELVVGEVSDRVEDARVLRTYFYDCPPYQSSSPTPEERERYSNKEKFFTALDSIPRFKVRKGKLAKRGRSENGNPIFVQKRVDIMFGVDLVTLALKHRISHAGILAGDSDFLPAIDVARREGVIIHLFHGSDYHKELWKEADERHRIDKEFITDVSM